MLGLKVFESKQLSHVANTMCSKHQQAVRVLTYINLSTYHYAVITRNLLTSNCFARQPVPRKLL